jgi:hypothetical protein
MIKQGLRQSRCLDHLGTKFFRLFGCCPEYFTTAVAVDYAVDHRLVLMWQNWARQQLLSIHGCESNKVTTEVSAIIASHTSIPIWQYLPVHQLLSILSSSTNCTTTRTSTPRHSVAVHPPNATILSTQWVTVVSISIARMSQARTTTSDGQTNILWVQYSTK